MSLSLLLVLLNLVGITASLCCVCSLLASIVQMNLEQYIAWRGQQQVVGGWNSWGDYKVPMPTVAEMQAPSPFGPNYSPQIGEWNAWPDSFKTPGDKT